MKSIYSVAQVNAYIRNMFLQDFMLQSISVRGEVSNCKYHSSGHIYFTLKDEKGTIACVMFASNRSSLKFKLEEGQQIVASGNIDVYERDGKYQLYVRKISLDGAGVLYERFENLKRELQEQGMFAPEYKKQIPKYIKTLGVVTAPTGAAVQDIINITKRRNPFVQIVLYPAIVQGAQAAASIVEGIKALEKEQVDVMIVGRGGGSMEDLWAFNEEIVAQAVFDCSIPIISAVGHETDTTIIDFVSDLRAPTPSAGAELAVFEIEQVDKKLKKTADTLNSWMKSKCLLYKNQIEQYGMRLNYGSPVNKIHDCRLRCAQFEDKMQDDIYKVLTKKRHALELYIKTIKGLSPLEKLNQGFSYVEDMNGQNINNIDKVSVDDSLRIHVKNGSMLVQVKGKEPRKWN